MTTKDTLLKISLARDEMLYRRIDDIGRYPFIRERLAEPPFEAETIEEAGTVLNTSIAAVEAIDLHDAVKARSERSLCATRLSKRWRCPRARRIQIICDNIDCAVCVEDLGGFKSEVRNSRRYAVLR